MASATAAINDRMSRVSGDARRHVDRVADPVETSRPLLESRRRLSTRSTRGSPKHVVGLVPDRATVQAGIGSVPWALLQRRRTHRDLGIHSELLSHDFADLVESSANILETAVEFGFLQTNPCCSRPPKPPAWDE